MSRFSKHFLPISNSDLTIELIQSVIDGQTYLWGFAHSFDGYEYFLPNATTDAWKGRPAHKVYSKYRRNFLDDNLLPETLSELRFCLFMQARIWRFISQAHQGNNFRDVWTDALLNAMLEKVTAGEFA